MKKLQSNNQGFIPMLLLLLTVVVIVIVLVFLRVSQNQ